MSYNKLPQGWVECKLEDVLIKLCNGTSKKQNKNASGVPVTRIETISDGVINFNRVGYISEISSEDIDTYKLISGDILFSNINSDFHLGKTAIYYGNELLLHGMNLLLIRLNKEIVLPSFINYYLNYCRFTGKFIKIAQHAVNQSSINQTKLKNFEIFLPPLNEQKRIVEKIEEEFAKINQGIEKLKSAQEQIKQYRQSVLKTAFNGKLYKTTEWEEKMFSQVLEVNPKTDIPDIKDDDLISFLPMPAVQAEINIYNEDFVKYSKVKKGYTKSKNRDVLFAKITPCMENGKSCVVDNLKFGIGFGSTEFHILRSLGSILPEFVFYYVVQESFRKRAQNVMTGAVGQRRVPADYLKNISINLPTIDEQKQIVKEIEKRFEVADEVERVIAENLEKAEQLKQSILKKAFEGRLVPQNPTDEPASILLDKIKHESEK